MSERPTPETDAAEYLISVGRKNDEWFVRSDVSRKLERERDEARELRCGDNQLIESLAEAVGIKITCNPKMLGIVWEQFHDGVLGLKRERDEARELAAKWEAVALREASINGARICGKEAAK